MVSLKRNVAIEYIFHFNFHFSVTWYFNSQPVNLNSQTSQNSVSSDGTLNMTLPDEGYYQCSAINDYGTAWSDVSWVRKLQLNSPTTAATREVTVNAGQSLTLPCITDPSITIIPAAIYKWQTVPDTSSTDIKDINIDRRIQVQDNGIIFICVLLSFNKILDFFSIRLELCKQSCFQKLNSITEQFLNFRN